MASTAKCPFCGAVVTSDQQQCPECGAKNDAYVEDLPRRILRPTTIEELKEYCAERGMPLLRMRFFVGEDFREPRAFGIYKDGERFVVYKNKADGSRAVRYSGPDEAYAVNELHSKLLEECHNRGIYPDGESPAPLSQQPSAVCSGSGKPAFRRLRTAVWIVLAVLLFGLSVYSGKKTAAESRPLQTGYYEYRGSWYYTEDSNYRSAAWYLWDDTGWKKSDVPGSALSVHRAYQGGEVSPEWGIREIPLHQEPVKGYYLYGDLLYYDGSWSWARFDSSEEQWVHASRPVSDGHLLCWSDFYRGSGFTEDLPGYDYLTEKGYYSISDEPWYYNGLWHLYDEAGAWKKASCPVKIPAPYYQGVGLPDQWNILAFPTRVPPQGYYLYEGKAYYHGTGVGSISGWAEFSTEDQKWHYSDGFPEYDPDGYAVQAEKYYGGTSFPAEWYGRDFEFPEGYYRYRDVTYYFSEKSPGGLAYAFSEYEEQLYRYENGWKLSDYPVGNLRDYYAGSSFQPEWEGAAFSLPGDPDPGYYRYNGTLYFATHTSGLGQTPWYQCFSGVWKKTDFPLFGPDGILLLPEDFYLGSTYDAAWGGRKFDPGKGYYRINGTTYYRDGFTWYRRSGRSGWSASYVYDDSSADYVGSSVPDGGASYETWRSQKESEERAERESRTRNSRDSWSSNDYDSWDSGDTDWDSDW